MAEDMHTPPRKKRVTRKQLRRRRIVGLAVLLLIIYLMSTGCAACIRCACNTGSTDNKDTSDNSETTTTVSSAAAVTQPAVPQETLVEALPESFRIEVEPILQKPELPTGAEITSLTMLLNYLDFNVDKETLARGYLTCADRGEATFTQAFIGSPFETDGLGCLSPVIVDTAQRYLRSQNSSRNVKSLNADSFDDVLLRVASGYPVLVWVNQDLELRQEEYCFTVYGGANVHLNTAATATAETSTIVLGTTAPVQTTTTAATTTEKTTAPTDQPSQDVYWIPNTTCVLLTGFDTVNNTVSVIDPAQGEISYDMGMFKTSYNALCKQAVIIY